MNPEEKAQTAFLYSQTPIDAEIDLEATLMPMGRPKKRKEDEEK